jgi:hypothetical protein
LFRNGQFYSAHFIGGGNRSSVHAPWALILRQLKKAKIYDFSFILSHSNKGIKHSEDFDKKKNSNVNTSAQIYFVFSVEVVK